MKPTIKDVAEQAGVSISTVSRVVNSPETVRKEKREKVQAVIDELKYSPNALARGLIFKQTQTVGVLIPDISNLFVSELVKGMEDTAREIGMNLILCNTEKDPERMVHYLTVLKEKQVDGIIFTSEPVTAEYYEMFMRSNIPVVLAATQSLEYSLPSVKIDDEKAAYDAVKHLVDKGHQNIGMISGPTTDSIAGFPRYLGFKQALKDLLDISDLENQVEFGAYLFQDGFEAMKRLLDKNSDVTAVFCASDEMALGAISYLYKKGLRVPEDISIMGFDNTKLAKVSIPQLTTVAQPIYEIGQQAMKTLHSTIVSKELKKTRNYLPHQIIERESVRDFSR